MSQLGTTMTLPPGTSNYRYGDSLRRFLAGSPLGAFALHAAGLLALLLALLGAGQASAADWAKNFSTLTGGNTVTMATAVDATNTYIAGYFTDTTLTLGSVTLTRIGDQDAFVAKLDADGTVLWAKNYGGSGSAAQAKGIALDDTGNVYLGGFFNTANLTTPALTRIGDTDAFALKLDAGGATTWSKNYGGSGATAVVNGIAVDVSGNVALGGYFYSASLTTPALTNIGFQDAFAFKLASGGATTWARSYGGSGARAYGYGIAVDGSGNVVLGGYFRDSDLTTPALTKGGSQDVLLIRVAPVTTPGAPTSVTATAGNAGVSVAFTAPANNGGGAISGYTVSCDTPNNFTALAFSQTGSSSPIVASGLANGTVYQCLVVATNSAGDAYSDLSNSFTPVAPSSGGYVPPANPTLPTGGGSTTLTGGQTVDVSNNGGSGSTINLPAPPTGGGSSSASNVTVNLPGNGGLTVASGGGNTQVSVQQATVGGRTVSTLTVTQGSATTTATASGQALVATSGAGIVVSANAIGTSASMSVANGNANLGVTGGSTITVQSGAQVAGTSVNLSANGSGNRTVTVEVGGQTLQVQVGSSSAQVGFANVMVNGVSTPVLTVTGGGALNVSAQNNGAPLLAVGNGGTLVQSAGGGSCQSVVNTQSNGQQTNVHVATCSVVLPANAFAGQGFAAVKDNTVLVGETVEFDAAGKVKKVRLGTLAGDTAIAGDKRGLTNSASLEYRAWVPLLDAVPTRFGSALKLSDAIVASLGKAAPEFAYQGMQDDGSLRFGSADGSFINALPVGTVEVDTAQPDGITIDAHGKVKVATQGLITRFSANAADLPAFAAGIRATCPTCNTVQMEDGNLHVTNGTTTYVAVAAWQVSDKPGASGLGNNPDGTLTYSSAGHSQTLYPAASDLGAILAACQAIDPAATAQTQNDGSVAVQINGNRYTLSPDYTMQTSAPAARAKDAWWSGESGRIFLKNGNGSVQGFIVK